MPHYYRGTLLFPRPLLIILSHTFAVARFWIAMPFTGLFAFILCLLLQKRSNLRLTEDGKKRKVD